MHALHAILRFWPWWALPLILISAEVGWYFHRKKSPYRIHCWVIVGVLTVLTTLWFIFRGDVNSDMWLRSLFGGLE